MPYVRMLEEAIARCIAFVAFLNTYTTSDASNIEVDDPAVVYGHSLALQCLADALRYAERQAHEERVVVWEVKNSTAQPSTGGAA